MSLLTDEELHEHRAAILRYTHGEDWRFDVIEDDRRALLDTITKYQRAAEDHWIRAEKAEERISALERELRDTRLMFAASVIDAGGRVVVSARTLTHVGQGHVVEQWTDIGGNSVFRVRDAMREETT